MARVSEAIIVFCDHMTAVAYTKDLKYYGRTNQMVCYITIS